MSGWHVSNNSGTRKYRTLTEICLSVTLNRSIPCLVEVVEDNGRVIDLDISLWNYCQQNDDITNTEGFTYSDMVVQVHADWEIDPLILRNHGWSVNSRVIDHSQLIRRTNATYRFLVVLEADFGRLTSQQQLGRAKSSSGKDDASGLGSDIDGSRMTGTNGALLVTFQLHSGDMTTGPD